MKDTDFEILEESITCLEFLGYTIRVWRGEATYNSTVAKQTEMELLSLISSRTPFGFLDSRESVAKVLIKADRVNAVEVRYEGNGVVMYKDWP